MVSSFNPSVGLMIPTLLTPTIKPQDTWQICTMQVLIIKVVYLLNLKVCCHSALVEICFPVISTRHLPGGCSLFLPCRIKVSQRIVTDLTAGQRISLFRATLGSWHYNYALECCLNFEDNLFI